MALNSTPLGQQGRPDRAVGAGQFQRLLGAPHLPALDGLRAVAVFTVIAYHSGFVSVPGDLGVSGFFVLSGFLITWLLLKEWSASGEVSLGRFYWRRTLRIFPAYYAFLAFSIGIDLVRGDSRIMPMILPGLTYLVNYHNAFFGHSASSIAHTWSLAVEEQFYLLWPGLFILLSRRGPRALRTGLVMLIAAVLTWRCAIFYTGLASASYVYNAFDTRFDNLAIGCLLAVVAREPWFAGPATRSAARPWYPLVTIGALFVSRVSLGSQWHYGPGFTVDALLLALLIVQLLQLSCRGGWRWLDHPVVRYLGLISYPLYLYHIRGIGLGRHVTNWWPVQLSVGIVCSILLASGSYYIVERPFLRLKGRF